MLDWKIYFLMILAYLKESNECKHDGINNYINPFYNEELFCPDCGKKIAIDWYLLKCSHCNTKREGFHILDNYIPKQKYCIKCGNDDFVVEIKNTLEFFELQQGSFKKRLATNDFIRILKAKSSTKVWIEPNNSYTENIFTTKLLPVSVPV